MVRREQFGEARKVPPLKTGEFVPRDRVAFGLPNLIPLAEEGKVAKVPRTLDEIQIRLKEEAGTRLPDDLTERFGLPGLAFVELAHPDSRSFFFVGYEKGKEGEDVTAKSSHDAVTTINLRRSNEMVWSGSPAGRYSNRLLPSDITISGIDRETKRVLVVRYAAKYDLPFFSEIRSEIMNSSVEFFIDEIHVSVGEEDGFTFKEEHGDMRSLPYEYVSQYANGVVTNTMVAKTGIDDESRHKKWVFVNRAPSVGTLVGPGSPLFFHASVQNINNYPRDFYYKSDNEAVVVGREQEWKIQLPRRLPRAGSFEFLKIRS